MKLKTYVIIILALVTGSLFDSLSQVKYLIPYIIVYLLLLNFTKVTLSFKDLLKKEVLVTIGLSGIVMPFITWYIVSWQATLELKYGLLLLSIAPSGIMMLVLSKYVHPVEKSLIVVNFFITHLASIILIPVVINHFIGTNIKLNLGGLIIKTMFMVGTPLIMSFFLKLNFFRIVKLVFVSSEKIILPLAIFFVISIAVASASDKIGFSWVLPEVFARVLLIYLIQGSLGFLCGWFFFKKLSVVNTLTLISSSRNSQFMLAISALYFSSFVGMVIVIGVFAHHITNAFWIFLLTKRVKSYHLREKH